MRARLVLYNDGEIASITTRVGIRVLNIYAFKWTWNIGVPAKDRDLLYSPNLDFRCSQDRPIAKFEFILRKTYTGREYFPMIMNVYDIIISFRQYCSPDTQPYQFESPERQFDIYVTTYKAYVELDFLFEVEVDTLDGLLEIRSRTIEEIVPSSLLERAGEVVSHLGRAFMLESSVNIRELDERITSTEGLSETDVFNKGKRITNLGEVDIIRMFTESPFQLEKLHETLFYKAIPILSGGLTSLLLREIKKKFGSMPYILATISSPLVYMLIRSILVTVYRQLNMPVDDRYEKPPEWNTLRKTITTSGSVESSVVMSNPITMGTSGRVHVLAVDNPPIRANINSTYDISHVVNNPVSVNTSSQIQATYVINNPIQINAEGEVNISIQE